MSSAGLGPTGAVGPRRATEAWGPTVTGWTGWIAFASTMLCLIGGFHIIQGLVGIFRDGYYAVTKDNLLVEVDYSVWGWFHLGLGLIAVAVGVGMMWGQGWARVVGVIFAVVSAVTNLAFLNAYPVWSVMIIAFDVLLIWALTVHGSEMRGRHGAPATWAE